MTSVLFPPTRQAALDRLSALLPRAGRQYAASRNYDYGPDDRSNVSMLSPYVRHRLITEQEIAAAVLEQHSAAAAEKFIQEIVWRTYWKGWLEQRPQVWERYLTDVAALQNSMTGDLRQRIDAALRGVTDIECFDTWAHELVEKGYLHNHARTWFASIWIFTLKLPWQLGADFFLRHLLDGDAASNTLSWRWVGGLHTLGKTYLARADNIATFTNGRFSVELDLAVEAVPLPPDDPGPRRTLTDLPSTPPVGPQVLIVTEDDLGIETWPIVWSDVQAVILLDTADSYSGVSAPVVAFKRAALADTAAKLRLRVADGVPVTILSATSTVGIVDALPNRLPVVMYELPIGASRTLAAPVWTALEQSYHDLSRLRRPWDAAFWPHTAAGFFKIKSKIPTVLHTLALVV